MIAVTNIEQGTPEWHAEKIGKPSASNFDKIITTKGEASKSRKKYMYQLAGEIVSGIKEDSYQSAAMARGVEVEAEARSLYEMLRESKIIQVGLCYQDDSKLFCCSPDGLVGEDGGLELKCPLMATHVGYLLDGKLPIDYFQQVQGSLFVTGRKWWDFMSYYPGIKPFILRVERDEKFIASLEFELKLFCKELEVITNKIK